MSEKVDVDRLNIMDTDRTWEGGGISFDLSRDHAREIVEEGLAGLLIPLQGCQLRQYAAEMSQKEGVL